MVRAERAVTSLRHFTSNASHQMRTPLAVLRVHLDVLQAYGAQSPQGAMALDDIAASVTNLERLLNQLLSLARLDEQAEPPMGSFDPAQVAADVIASRLPAIESAGVSITFAQGLPSRRWPRAGFAGGGDDRQSAGQCGGLQPARRHGGLRVSSVDSRARVEIEDDGPGIPEAERERVWERFYRVDATAHHDGSGLGLSIVRALSERMGARVTLKAGTGGRGTLG
jgi:two-component system sensor histidine kinase TctE